jgi:hypothetical protein
LAEVRHAWLACSLKPFHTAPNHSPSRSISVKLPIFDLVPCHVCNHKIIHPEDCKNLMWNPCTKNIGVVRQQSPVLIRLSRHRSRHPPAGTSGSSLSRRSPPSGGGTHKCKPLACVAPPTIPPSKALAAPHACRRPSDRSSTRLAHSTRSLS